MVVASFVLFGISSQCRGQPWTEPARQLRDLETAFHNAPKVSIETRGSEPYYDIAIKNVCDGEVANLARNWVGQEIANFLNRLVLISASVEFPDGRRPPLMNPIPILVAGNTADVSWRCEDLTIQGIRANQR